MASLFPPELCVLAEKTLSALREKRQLLVLAESCTGGLLSACLTEIPGSSDVVDRGFVTYSNDAKMAHLSVERKTIQSFGAVSAETALEMALGAVRASHADIGVSITGIAGPGGGTDEKPVGLVYIGIAKKSGDVRTIRNTFEGDRGDIRTQAVKKALEEIIAETATSAA